MVQVAQEKADLTEQSEILAKQIEKEEEELASLEQAMKLMKNSNDSYRVTNCRSGELHTDQTIELEESIKNKLTAQKQLKRRMFELGQDIANIEYIVNKCQEEADTIQAFTEGELLTYKYLKVLILEKNSKIKSRFFE